MRVRYTLYCFIIYILIHCSFTAKATDNNDWWDTSWKYRRSISISGNTKNKLPVGTPVRLYIDTLELDISKKVKDTCNDFRIVYNGKSTPAFIERHPTIAGRYYLWFKTATVINKGETDRNYWLYYGNDSAEYAFAKGGDIFPIFDDFKGNILNNDLWKGDSSIKFSSNENNLTVEGIDGKKESSTITLKKMPNFDNFCIETSIGYEKGGGGISKFLITFQMSEGDGKKELSDEEKKNIISLTGKLGADDWQTRKDAEESLINLGKVVMPYVEQVLTSKDAEIVMRAERILETIGARYPIPSVRLGVIIKDTGQAEAYSFAYGNRLWYNFKLVNEGNVSFKLVRFKDGRIDMYNDGNNVFSNVVKGKPHSIDIEVEKDDQTPFRPITLQPLRIYPISETDIQLTLDKEEGKD